MHILTVDCEWNQWGDWSACSRDCERGQQSRKRTKKNVALNGGEQCIGNHQDKQDCNIYACPGSYLLKALLVIY